MKLLKLEIHHIASIVQATIDFENSAIAREPLFLICGETGAGKSTILNCICMALYNRVPTMPNSREYFNEQKIGDLSNFLRKGTGEGYIHLCFEEAGIDYEADWTVRRAHNKPGGKLQNIERILINVTTGDTIATKVNEVERSIEQIVGLDFDRFTRMFMLAQGQFNKFLTADEKEKSTILESLTQMDIYNRVGKYIHDKKCKVEAELCRISQQIADIRLLTDEEKVEKQQQIAETEKAIKKLNDELASCDEQIGWLNAVKAAESGIDAAKVMLLEKQAKMEGNDNKEKLHEIQLWDETADLRGCLRDIIKQEGANKVCMASLHESKTECAKYLSWMDRVEEELSRKTEELHLEEELWNKLKVDETTYENQQTIKAGLDAVTAWNNENVTLQKSMNDIELQRMASCKALDEIKKKVVAADEEWNKSVVARADKKKEIDAARKENLQLNRNVLAAELAGMESAKGKWLVVDAASKALKDGQKLVQQQTTALVSMSKELDEAHVCYAKAEKEYKDRQQMLDTRKLTIDDCAKELRKSLEDGQPCPICGSTHHEVCAEGIFNGLYQQAKVARDEADRERNEVKEHFIGIQTKKKMGEKELAKAKELLPLLTENLAKAEMEWMPFADKYTDGQPFDTCFDMLELHIRKCNEQIAKLDKQLAAVKVLENNLEAIRNAVEANEKNLLHWKEKQNAQQHAIEQADVKTVYYGRQIENNKKSLEERIAKLDKLLSWRNWQEDWTSQHVAFEAKLESESRSYMNCKQQLPLLQSAIRMISCNVENCKNTLSSLYLFLPDWQGMEKVTSAEADCPNNLSEKLSAFVAKVKSQFNLLQDNERTKAALIRSKEELLEAYQKGHQEHQLCAHDMEALLSMNGDTINSLRKETDGLKSDVQEIKGKVKQLTEDMANLQRQSNRPAEEDTIELLVSRKAERNSMKDEKLNSVGGLKEQIKNDAACDSDRKRLLEQLDKQKGLYNNWTALDGLFGLDRFSKAAQQITFRFLLENANQYLRKLYPRYNLQCAPDSFALAVEDEEMGTSRPCTTLSGGESFIVSLALALGLSSLSDEKIKVYTLFIDEGFGTLSAEYLDTVMKVLEGLQRTGRRVGIISHVEILRERIPAQIQVLRKSRTESEIKVVG